MLTPVPLLSLSTGFLRVAARTCWAKNAKSVRPPSEICPSQQLFESLVLPSRAVASCLTMNQLGRTASSIGLYQIMSKHNCVLIKFGCRDQHVTAPHGAQAEEAHRAARACLLQAKESAAAPATETGAAPQSLVVEAKASCSSRPGGSSCIYERLRV